MSVGSSRGRGCPGMSAKRTLLPLAAHRTWSQHLRPSGCQPLGPNAADMSPMATIQDAATAPATRPTFCREKSTAPQIGIGITAIPPKAPVSGARHEAAGSERCRALFLRRRRLEERRSGRRSRALRGRQQARHARGLRLPSHPEREPASRPIHSFIEPVCGPATKNLSGCIRWLEERLAGMRPAEMVRASQNGCRAEACFEPQAEPKFGFVQAL